LSSKHKPHYRGRAQSEPLGRPVEYKRKRVRFEIEDDQEEITGIQVRRSGFNWDDVQEETPDYKSVSWWRRFFTPRYIALYWMEQYRENPTSFTWRNMVF